jgi:hypothetical protein
LKGKQQAVFLFSVGLSISIMGVQKGLTRKHMEAILKSRSEDNFDISDDKSDNSNSDVTDSDSTDESNNDSSDRKCDISNPQAQRKPKVNNWKWNPTYSPSERLTKLPHKSIPQISPALTNNLPQNVKCVDILKQILLLATDFWKYLNNQTNKYGNEKIISDVPSTRISKKPLEY